AESTPACARGERPVAQLPAQVTAVGALGVDHLLVPQLGDRLGQQLTVGARPRSRGERAEDRLPVVLAVVVGHRAPCLASVSVPLPNRWKAVRCDTRYVCWPVSAFTITALRCAPRPRSGAPTPWVWSSA